MNRQELVTLPACGYVQLVRSLFISYHRGLRLPTEKAPLLFGGPEWKFSSAAQGIFQLGQGPVASCSALDRDLKILGTRLQFADTNYKELPGAFLCYKYIILEIPQL